LVLYLFSGQWVVINGPLPKFTKVYVYGVIEFNNTNPDLKVELSATHIFVSGGRIVAGYSVKGDHMQGQVTIKLRGDHNTPDMPLPAGPNMGAKALGGYIYVDHPPTCLLVYKALIIYCHLVLLTISYRSRPKYLALRIYLIIGGFGIVDSRQQTTSC
jgi:hypothetical protein